MMLPAEAAAALEAVGPSGLDELLPEGEPAAAQSAGGAQLSPVARLLAVSRDGGREVLNDIDRILEIAQQSGNGT